jgi:plasmid stabilization system protein ParE
MKYKVILQSEAATQAEAAYRWIEKSAPENAARWYNRLLDAIYSLAYGRDGGLENDADYPLVLAYGSMCAREALERTPRAGAIANLCGAACGFDSGDALHLGRFDGERFSVDVAAA